MFSRSGIAGMVLGGRPLAWFPLVDSARTGPTFIGGVRIGTARSRSAFSTFTRLARTGLVPGHLICAGPPLAGRGRPGTTIGRVVRVRPSGIARAIGPLTPSGLAPTSGARVRATRPRPTTTGLTRTRLAPARLAAARLSVSLLARARLTRARLTLTRLSLARLAGAGLAATTRRLTRVRLAGSTAR